MLVSERQRLQITPERLHPSLLAIIAAIQAQLDDIDAQKWSDTFANTSANSIDYCNQRVASGRFPVPA